MAGKKLTAEADRRIEIAVDDKGRRWPRTVGGDGEVTVARVQRARGDGARFDAVELGIEGSPAGVQTTLDVYEAGELCRILGDFVEQVTGCRP